MIGNIHIAGHLSKLARLLRVAEDLAATPGIHSGRLVTVFYSIATTAMHGVSSATAEQVVNALTPEERQL